MTIEVIIKNNHTGEYDRAVKVKVMNTWVDGVRENGEPTILKSQEEQKFHIYKEQYLVISETEVSV